MISSRPLVTGPNERNGIVCPVITLGYSSLLLERYNNNIDHNKRKKIVYRYIYTKLFHFLQRLWFFLYSNGSNCKLFLLQKIAA